MVIIKLVGKIRTERNQMAKKLSDATSPLRVKKFAVRTLAYAAGIIDGEGSIGAYRIRNTVHVKVTVGMTNELIPQWFLEQFGGSLRLDKSGPSHQKPCWTWNASAGDMLPLMKLLIPFLKLKQRQARLLMVIRTGMIRKRPVEKHDRAVMEMARLNQKGTIPSSSEAIRDPEKSEDMVHTTA